MTRFVAIACLLLVPPLVADDKKPAADPDLKGKWEITAATYDGQERDDMKGGQLVVGDGEIKAVKDGKEVRTLKFTVDPKASPKRIDMARPDGKSAPGIYAVEKDELKLCYRDFGDADSGPPKAFESKPAERMFLLVLKRVKP